MLLRSKQGDWHLKEVVSRIFHRLEDWPGDQRQKSFWRHFTDLRGRKSFYIRNDIFYLWSRVGDNINSVVCNYITLTFMLSYIHRVWAQNLTLSDRRPSCVSRFEMMRHGRDLGNRNGRYRLVSDILFDLCFSWWSWTNLIQLMVNEYC